MGYTVKFHSFEVEVDGDDAKNEEEAEEQALTRVYDGEISVEVESIAKF